MVRIIVDNRLRMKLSELPDGLAEAIRSEFTHNNPAFFKARQRVVSYIKARGGNVDPKNVTVKGEPEKITTWIEQGGEISVPRGATNTLRKLFERSGLQEPEWEDRRISGGRSLGAPNYQHSLQLWDHQEEIVEAALAKENCLIRASTGSGKTSAAIALAVRCGLPTLILVWSSNLFDQWLDRLTVELGLSRGDIGQLRGSKRTLAPITVAMQQTLYANPKFTAKIAKLFGCILADECQRFSARTFKEVIDMFPARYRIGWSADETRKDKKEFLIYESFGAVAADIGREKLVKRHLVHDVEIRVIPTDFKADWYRKQQIEDKTPDFNRLIEEITRDPKRNLTATSVARTMMTLGHQVLMLTHRREHASYFVREELAYGTRAGLLLGGPENASEFDSTVKAMRAREMSFGAGTYQAIGVGMDIPSVSRGIACTPIATNRQFFGQVCGRLCRTSKGKTDASLYYLWDKEVFGLEPIMQLKKWNKVVMVEGEGGWIPVEDFIDEWNRSRGKR